MTGKTEPLNATLVHDGDGRQDAVEIGKGIHMSRDVSNLYLVQTADGDVLINTGINFHAGENRRRLRGVSDRAPAKIVFTQSHTDHIGGWGELVGEGTETIAQANYPHVRGYWRALRPAMSRRSSRLWAGALVGDTADFAEPVVDTLFHDRHEFALGGRSFELLSVPGGETLDSLVVWLPEERIAFTGNMTGPIFGHVPNLYTLRGDKIRYVQSYLDAVQRVIDLSPEVLVTGHGDPLRGAAEIRHQLGRIHAATSYLRDRTFEGMNAGVDLWTLMQTISLPDDLAIGQGHGKVPWIVRSIWEEHLGWFRFERTTELYAVPPSRVAADLATMAGTDKVLALAQARLDQGRVEEALHLAEAALEAVPDDVALLRVQLRGTEELLRRSGRENFSEVRWLEAEIRRIGTAIEEAAR